MADTKSVDASLWWDSFTLLFTELENSSLSSDLSQNLAKKLEDNHAWFVDAVSRFKPPNEESKEALNSKKLQIGSHQLTILPHLKDKALQISSCLQLDEVQSYILTQRSIKHNNAAVDSMVQEFLHVIVIQYYTERQCLLKCIRWILMHAIYIGPGSKEHFVKEEARKLFHDGLENKLISFFQDLLSFSYPEQMDVDLFTLWAEETLIEDNLVLDILFLAYYDSFCTCSSEKWKKFCSLYKGIISGHYNLRKLAITSEAQQLSYHAKVQLLLILIETLDLENLLQMVHDEIPYSKGVSTFSLTDVQEMDALVSTLNDFEMKEAGPLILAWAVFLYLLLTLPGNDENNELMEIDHVSYVRQAFEAASFSYCLEFLKCDILREHDGPVSGYRSVLRTFLSAFIASYEVNLQEQPEDNNPGLILDILCNIYRGEESLCIQFWDKSSYTDGPIRSLLCNLESEFPFQTVELVQLLSCLCEGTWPAECVYNFLDRSVGVSSSFEIRNDSLVNVSHIVEARQPVQVPGIEGFFIPAGTRGQVLKLIEENTALVRWEYATSGVFILLLHMAQEMYLNSKEEVLLTLDLLSRLVSFNTAVCFELMNISNSVYFQPVSLMNEQEKNVWVIELICNLVKNPSLNSFGAALMSKGIKILWKMLICSPSTVTEIALNANIFDMALQTTLFSRGNNDLLSGSWLLSGKLAKMLLIDCEQNSNDCPLAISVLDFTMQLVETGMENDCLLALIIFSLQYVLVNHESWKYKVKHIRWKVTLKVLELMKKCIILMPYHGKFGEIIHDVLFSDSSIHRTLFQIACTTAHTLEKLHVSRLFDPMEIEGLQLAIGSVLDVLFVMLTKLSKETSPGFTVFHQAVFSCTNNSVPVVAAVTSLVSYFRDPAIQIGAARVISILFSTADSNQPFSYGTTCFTPDSKQIVDLKHSLNYILLEQSLSNEDLFIATVNLLTSAAHYQPAFLIAIFASEEKDDNHVSIIGDVKQQKSETSLVPQVSKKSCLVDALMYYVERAEDLIKSNPCILLSVLNFMVALWQGAPQYINILESLRSSEKFWKYLSNAIVKVAGSETPLLVDLTEKDAQNLANSYLCQSAILGIMAYELFLQKKLLHAESLLKDAAGSEGKEQDATKTEKSKTSVFCDLKEIWSSWCKDSVLEKLMKSYTCGYNYDIYYSAKVAISLFSVHVMEKLASGDSGSLSVSLLQKIHTMLTKLSIHPAFSELLSHYSQHGYSEGKKLKKLILSDLYYHLQGELEGRKVGIGPFKELSQYLVESNILGTYQHQFNDDFPATTKNVYFFDLLRLQADIGFDVWDCSEWKVTKEIAETMLHWLQDANSVMLLSSSKLSALKALIAALTVYHGDIPGRKSAREKIPDQLIFTCIENTCQSFHATVEKLAPVFDVSEDILNFLASQAELLLQLTRTVCRSLSFHIALLVLKCARSGLKLLSELKLLPSGANVIMKLLLILLLSVLESDCLNSRLGGAIDEKVSEGFSKVSNAILGLLPILCKCITAPEHCMLSLSVMDLILRNFLMPKTWLPVIQSHLQLQLIMLKLQDKTSSIPIILKFILTLARVRGGAEMLYCSGFLSSLRVLFAASGEAFSRIPSENLSSSYETFELSRDIWGLGLAVVTAMVQSLGDSSSCTAIVDSMIPYFFLENAYLVFNSLNAPDLPTDDPDKKRPRAQRSWMSFADLKETEHTLMLMCELAKHWDSWTKLVKEVDRQLREKCIHLLAFISRGTQRLGESSGRSAPLLCQPTNKEDFDSCSKPPYINSKNGWFAISPLCFVSKLKTTSFSAALTIYGQASGSTGPTPRTYFSDTLAVQIYRIAYLLLKFLCLQAEGAVKRAEEVGFVDIAHFPELPMPEILHGLQDQAIAIVTELCEANKQKVSREIQTVCNLLLQIIEMALQLELCVLQICGIRPVLGRMEDFLKEIKTLFGAMEQHGFLKTSKKSLKQMIAFVYPGMMQAEDL